MKFGLMYEIGMPKPWYGGQEAEKCHGAERIRPKW